MTIFWPKMLLGFLPSLWNYPEWGLGHLPRVQKGITGERRPLNLRENLPWWGGKLSHPSPGYERATVTPAPTRVTDPCANSFLLALSYFKPLSTQRSTRRRGGWPDSKSLRFHDYEFLPSHSYLKSLYKLTEPLQNSALHLCLMRVRGWLWMGEQKWGGVHLLC